jgi:NitT/TauT family transport system permease protein
MAHSRSAVKPASPAYPGHDPVRFRSRRYSPDERRYQCNAWIFESGKIARIELKPRSILTGFLLVVNGLINVKQNQLGLNPQKFRRILVIPVSILGAILLWESIVQLGDFPAFILPSPILVGERFLSVLSDGSLLRHLISTLMEVLVGLALGVLVATVLGYFLAKSPLIERILSPYIVASQSVPIVAVAPLLVIWFGPGLLSKVMICALIVFFPVLVNTMVGLRSVPEDLRDLMRSLQASRLQTIRYLEVPAALPIFLGGLRIGATLAVIGAVVGEFVGSDSGLGFMINRARGQYDTALVFVSVLILVFIAITLYGLVVILEKRMLSWREQPEENLNETNFFSKKGN